MHRRRAVVLRALAEHGPMPLGRLDRVTGWRSVRPGFWSLYAEGLIDSGEAVLPDGTRETYYRLADGALSHTTDKNGTPV
jgi:hypothetical protein